MSNLYPITVDTNRHAFLYGPFVIKEIIGGWEWTHEDYDYRILEHEDLTGICDTVFEAIEAADKLMHKLLQHPHRYSRR